MGKLGPFEQGNFDVHKVSALAPAWMNKNKEIEVEAKSRDLSPAYSAMNKEQKRMFLFEGEGKVELGKIVDRTPKAEPFEEIKRHAGYRPRIFYKWDGAGSENKVTGKVGCLD